MLPPPHPPYPWAAPKRLILNRVKELNYIEHLVILVSVVIGCIPVSAFASLAGIAIGIGRCAAGLKICQINALIKKCNSVIKKKIKKRNKIVLLEKTRLNTIKVWIFKALISTINHYEFVLVKGYKEYNDLKEAIKNPDRI